MTINSEYAPMQYSGPKAIDDVCPINFKFLEDEHIVVELLKVDKAIIPWLLGTNYTLLGVGEDTGGSLIVKTEVLTGESLTISMNVPATQLVDYGEGDKFPAEAHEGALDKLTRIAQQQKAVDKRSLKLPASTALADELLMELPEANKGLKWNSTGTKIINTEVDIDSAIDEIELAQTTAEGARDTALLAKAAAEGARDTALAAAATAEEARDTAIDTRDQALAIINDARDASLVAITDARGEAIASIGIEVPKLAMKYALIFG